MKNAWFPPPVVRKIFLRLQAKKEKIEEKRGPKGPSPESKMKLRIKSYLNENTDKAYIDYNDMAKSLHDKFPEYKRIKFKVFRVTVEDCFNKILTALNKESESPQKETPKETTKEKEVPKEAPNEKESSKEAPKEPPKE